MKKNSSFSLLSVGEMILVLRKKILTAFLCIAMAGCVTWDLGKIGYIEPSKTKLEQVNKKLAGEECTVIMGDPFLEIALKKAKVEKLKNAIIMLEPDGLFGTCFRIYSDAEDDRGELKK